MANAKLTISMLAPEDRPATHARVMKIASQADSEKSTPRASSPSTIPAVSAEAEQRNPITASISGSSSSSSAEQKVAKYEDDYQDEDGMTSTSNATEEDGWDVVSRKKSTFSLVACSMSLALLLTSPKATSAERGPHPAPRPAISVTRPAK